MNSKNEYITQAEFARRIGSKKPHVGRLKKAGRLVMRGDKVNYEESLEKIEATSDPARAPFRKTSQPPIPAKSPMTYEHVRTAKEAGRAKLIQLEVKEKEGELVNAEELRHILTAAATAVKTSIRAIQAFLPLDISRIYESNDAAKQLKVRELLAKRHDEALEGLSKWTPPNS